MNTHFKRIQKDQVRLADAPAHALAAYNTFYCPTPAAFKMKARHLDAQLNSTCCALVIIDVLRATTTLTAVGAAGASGIQVAIKPLNGENPFISPTDRLGPWVGGGEQNGMAIPGGCIANSPVEVTEALFSRKWLKFVSTNGASSVIEAELCGADQLYLASIPNIDATVRAAIANGAESIVFVGGGFYGAGTIEDTVCAGRGINTLIDRGFANIHTLDDEALMAFSVAAAFRDEAKLIATLNGAQVGRLLTEIGRGPDIEAVINGSGVDPGIWERMRSIVLRYSRVEGIGVFVPSTTQEEMV